MSYPALSHLTRRGDVFYFRRAVPLQLTALFRRKEWKFSLRTSDRDTARLRCRKCSNAFDQIMIAVRLMPSVDAKEINLLVRNFFEHLLSEGADTIFRIRDGKFWLPLLALLSGARMSELIQLTTSDVRQDNGAWCLDINKVEEQKTGKSLKSFASQRLIPLHSELIQIGFLDFVKEMKRLKRTRIFDEIKPGKNGLWSHNYSKYIGRYLIQISVKTKKTTFHSFRHNFADALRAANVEDSHIRALMGHAGGTVTSTYGFGVPLNVLVDDMEKVIFKVKLEHLHI